MVQSFGQYGLDRRNGPRACWARFRIGHTRAAHRAAPRRRAAPPAAPRRAAAPRVAFGAHELRMTPKTLWAKDL